MRKQIKNLNFLNRELLRGEIIILGAGEYSDFPLINKTGGLLKKYSEEEMKIWQKGKKILFAYVGPGELCWHKNKLLTCAQKNKTYTLEDKNYYLYTKEKNEYLLIQFIKLKEKKQEKHWTKLREEVKQTIKSAAKNKGKEILEVSNMPKSEYKKILGKLMKQIYKGGYSAVEDEDETSELDENQKFIKINESEEKLKKVKINNYRIEHTYSTRAWAFYNAIPDNKPREFNQETLFKGKEYKTLRIYLNMKFEYLDKLAEIIKDYLEHKPENHFLHIKHAHIDTLNRSERAVIYIFYRDKEGIQKSIDAIKQALKGKEKYFKENPPKFTIKIAKGAGLGFTPQKEKDKRQFFKSTQLEQYLIEKLKYTIPEIQNQDLSKYTRTFGGYFSTLIATAITEWTLKNNETIEKIFFNSEILEKFLDSKIEFIEYYAHKDIKK